MGRSAHRGAPHKQLPHHLQVAPRAGGVQGRKGLGIAPDPAFCDTPRSLHLLWQCGTTPGHAALLESSHKKLQEDIQVGTSGRYAILATVRLR